MELSLKEKTLIGLIGIVSVAAIGGSVWALTVNKETGSKEQDRISKEDKLDNSVEDKTNLTISKDDKPSDSKATDGSSPQIDTAPQTNTSTSTPPSSPRNTEQSTGTRTSPSPAPPKGYVVPAQPVMVCDEDMKASYAYLRDAQISAENARWARQVDGFHDEANRRGGAFGGYAQAMINEARPIHESNLADIETRYQLNIRSINC